MAEPTSTGAGSYAVYKLAIAYGLPPMIISIVVMLMTQPRSAREWIVGLTTTVVGSICGGAFLIEYYEWQSLVNSTNGLIAMFGMVFGCGLPWWVLVRSFFSWTEKRKNKDIKELAVDAIDAYNDVKNKIAGSK